MIQLWNCDGFVACFFNRQDEAIDMENRKTLMNASPEEAGFDVMVFTGAASEWCQVKAWQEQLFQQLGAETCEFLRKRGEKKMVKEKRKSKVEKKTPPQAWCCLVGCRMLVGQFLTNHNLRILKPGAR